MKRIIATIACLCASAGALAQVTTYPQPDAPTTDNGIPLVPAKIVDAQCVTLIEADRKAIEHGGLPFEYLNHDQWQFLRGMSLASDQSAPGVPPGDRAMISRSPNHDATVIFVDGAMACYPMRLVGFVPRLIDAIGKGDLVHAGGPPT